MRKMMKDFCYKTLFAASGMVVLFGVSSCNKDESEIDDVTYEVKDFVGRWETSNMYYVFDADKTGEYGSKSALVGDEKEEDITWNFGTFKDNNVDKRGIIAKDSEGFTTEFEIIKKDDGNYELYDTGNSQTYKKTGVSDGDGDGGNTAVALVKGKWTHAELKKADQEDVYEFDYDGPGIFDDGQYYIWYQDKNTTGGPDTKTAAITVSFTAGDKSGTCSGDGYTMYGNSPVYNNYTGKLTIKVKAKNAASIGTYSIGFTQGSGRVADLKRPE